MAKTAKVPYEAPQALVEAIENVVANAINQHYDRASDEVFTLCTVCGEWEEHTDECPVPWMTVWLADGLRAAQSQPTARYSADVQHVERFIKAVQKPTPTAERRDWRPITLCLQCGRKLTAKERTARARICGRCVAKRPSIFAKERS